MDNRCVCCVEIIPEGRWVCPNCEANIKNKTSEPTVKVVKSPDANER